MHPNLVAGAWVGFNDARVTMRSNYWGQGGHNALLLVGDFFRSALKAKLIDGKAQFPQARRPTPPSEPPLPVEASVSVNRAGPMRRKSRDGGCRPGGRRRRAHHQPRAAEGGLRAGTCRCGDRARQPARVVLPPPIAAPPPAASAAASASQSLSPSPGQPFVSVSEAAQRALMSPPTPKPAAPAR